MGVCNKILYEKLQSLNQELKIFTGFELLGIWLCSDYHCTSQFNEFVTKD